MEDLSIRPLQSVKELKSVTKDISFTRILLCTLPGRRLDTAEGGERARLGRVLVCYVHFYLHL